MSSWVRRDVPHWWLPALIALTGLYALLTLLVLAGSGVTEFDAFWYNLDLAPLHTPWHLPIELWVFLGQRGPAMIIAGLFVLYRALHTRSWTPVVLYGLAGTGFVVSVLAIKYVTGRIGPRFTDQAHTVWDGGNIFPSGHVTGTVVMYGVIALLAPQVYRRVATIVAIVLSVTIGFGTVALNTHWLSDVVGAWLNGAIVLLIVWAITPEVQRRLQARLRHLREWHHAAVTGAVLPAAPGSAAPAFGKAAHTAASAEPSPSARPEAARPTAAQQPDIGPIRASQPPADHRPRADKPRAA